MESRGATISCGHHAFTASYDWRLDFIYTGCGVSLCGKRPSEKNRYDELVAFWDTGAKMTTISPSVIKRLGGSPLYSLKVNTIAGVVERWVYRVDVYLPGQMIIPNVEAMEGYIAHGDVLIGMDIIMMGDFAISNLDGKTTFTFRVPSECVFDFCAKNR